MAARTVLTRWYGFPTAPAYRSSSYISLLLWNVLARSRGTYRLFLFRTFWTAIFVKKKRTCCQSPSSRSRQDEVFNNAKHPFVKAVNSCGVAKHMLVRSASFSRENRTKVRVFPHPPRKVGMAKTNSTQRHKTYASSNGSLKLLENVRCALLFSFQAQVRLATRLFSVLRLPVFLTIICQLPQPNIREDMFPNIYT